MPAPQPRYLLGLLPLMLALGCAPSDGGQVGEETLSCQPVEEETLGPVDESPLAFTVMEVLNLVDGEHTSPLVWADANTTSLHATLSFTGVARYQDREWIDENGEGSGPEDQLEVLEDCADILEIEMSLQLQSDDGLLDEEWIVRLQSATVDTARAAQSLGSLGGSLAIESFAPSGDFSRYSATLSLEIDAAGLRGRIDGQAESSDGAGPDDAVSATNYEIASFGTAPN